METLEIETQAAAEKPPVVYDASAEQRYQFEIKENGRKFKSAHRFKPVDDERHFEFVGHLLQIEYGEQAAAEKNAAEKQTIVDFWRNQIIEIENVEIEDGSDFHDFADADNEIVPMTTMLLAVVVKNAKAASGKRQFGTAKSSETQSVRTEAFFDGLPVEQTHTLKAKSDEYQKKYNRLQRSQYKVERTEGLRREPKLEIVPQHKAKGLLYDEMYISSTGFADDIVPLRFKVVVIDDIFSASIDPKK